MNEARRMRRLGAYLIKIRAQEIRFICVFMFICGDELETTAMDARSFFTLSSTRSQLPVVVPFLLHFLRAVSAELDGV